MSARSHAINTALLLSTLTGKPHVAMEPCRSCNGTKLYRGEGCAECEGSGERPVEFDEDAPSHAHSQKVLGA